MAGIISRRGFLKGLSSIVLAGALVAQGFSAGNKKEDVNLKKPLESLQEEDKSLVHSVLTRGDKQIYIIGENHGEIERKYEKYVRIINSESIDCIFLEGLEGKIDDKYIEKIERDIRLIKELAGEKQEKIGLIDLPAGIIFIRESGEIIIPDLDFREFTVGFPGAGIARLIKPVCNIDIYGVDNSYYMSECRIGAMKSSFEKAFKKIEESRKRQKEDKDYDTFDYQNFRGNFDLRNYEAIKINLEKRMEEARKIAPWFIDFEEMKEKNPEFLQERYVKKRDEYAVKKILEIIGQNKYKRGLVIRGFYHINTMRKILNKNGFVSLEYDPDKFEGDIDGRVFNLASQKRLGY